MAATPAESSGECTVPATHDKKPCTLSVRLATRTFAMAKDGAAVTNFTLADPPAVTRVDAHKLDVKTLDAKGKVKVEHFVFDQTGNLEHVFAALSAFPAVETLQAEHRNNYLMQQVTIFVGTMNMGDAPTSDDLSPWILPGFDLYAFSLQESGYKPADGAASAEAHICSQIERQLGSDYVRVEVASLAAIRNLVFMRTSLAPLLSNVASATEATGIAHVGSNKGGVGIAFKLGETSFCFIASHLAAHDGEVERRNSDYKEILQGLMKLSSRDLCLTTNFNLLFWAGDLNYRLELPRDDAIALANAGDVAGLLERDQLRAQIAQNKVFYGFREGDITFTPTYKFEPGTREYDTKKMRTPSYTDRVLYSCSPEYQEFLTQTAYGACHAIMTSDHSPVFATFTTSVLTRPYLASDLGTSACTKSLYITNLAARDLRALDLNGSSDPYVRFAGACLDLGPDEGKTEVIKKDLNPSWPNEVRLKLVRDDHVYLAQQCVLVVVMDADRGSKDDVIGSGWLHLDPVLGPEPSFSVPLRHHGLPAGVVTGVVRMRTDR